MDQDLITVAKYLWEAVQLSWIPNALGILGGILGAYTFVDNYLLPFKPKIFLGGKMSFEGRRGAHLRKREFYLNSIIISLEIGNHRNRYGFINDFAARIYSASELNPHKGIYYVSKFLPAFPTDLVAATNATRPLFSPFAVLPKSKQTLILEFSELTNMSQMFFSDNCEAIVEVYYQEYPNSKWQLITTDRTLPGPAYDGDPVFIQREFINKRVSRDAIAQVLPPIRVDMHNGLTDRHLYWLGVELKFWGKRPFSLIAQLTNTAYISLVLLAISAYDITVRRILLRKYSKTIVRPKIHVGVPDLVGKTNLGIEYILKYFQELAEENNKTADPAAQIHWGTLVPSDPKQPGVGKAELHTLHERLSSEFSRNGMRIKIYKCGDVNIIAQGFDKTGASRFTFQINQIRLIRSLTYWELENYGPITLQSFALRVFDAFVLHSR